MKKIIIPIVLAVVAYAVYDIVREIKGAYTSGYSRTYSRAVGQLMSLRFDSLRLSGRGIKIGVLDAGFGGFRTDRWTKGLQVGAYCDFTGGDDAAFFADQQDHGTKVCANIGGFSGDTLLGLANNAVYYLAKTDRADVEPRAEEQQFIQGVEWLLSQDVDMISSSLSYTVFDDFGGYTPAMLDGRSSVLSRYLDSLLTARPNLVFVQSAGNEGNKKWKYITFPADVRQVITVGSTNSEGTSRYRSSSIGWDNSDNIKPDFAVSASPIGTSFSTPIITGLCAALLEYCPMPRDSLIAVLCASGSNAVAPDREIGAGVPQTGKLLELIDNER